MDENQIEEIKNVFSNWDPLKTVGKVVDDLDNYNTEAIDFIFHASKNMTEKSLENLVINIIEQAFAIDCKNSGNIGESLLAILKKY